MIIGPAFAAILSVTQPAVVPVRYRPTVRYRLKKRAPRKPVPVIAPPIRAEDVQIKAVRVISIRRSFDSIWAERIGQ